MAPDIVSHMALLDPRLPIPENMSKEWISLSFVRALCAQAGLNVSSWDWDDGLDLTIGSAKAGFCGCTVRNVKFHLQLKCTEKPDIRHGKLAYWMKASKYNDLVAESVDPQHLVVYTLPDTRSKWLQAQDQATIWRNCAYFYSFNNLKRLPATAAGEVIMIPPANRLTAGELIKMYRDAAMPWMKKKKAS